MPVSSAATTSPASATSKARTPVQVRQAGRRPTTGAGSNAPAPPRRIQVVDRALHALEELAEAPGGLGVSELGRRLGVDKSSAHRLLTTLLAHGFVRQNPHSGRYQLGLRLAGLGAIAVRGVDLTDVARPHLERLRDQTGEAASLAVLSDGEVLFLAKAVSQGALTVNQGVGSRMPAHCSALGKVLLAWSEDEAVARAIAQRGLARHTPRTIASEEELRRHLARVQEQGWALDDEEFAIGLRCLAAPVRDSSGTVVAAVGISGPTSRITLRDVEPMAGAVCEAGLAISSDLGYRRGTAR